MASSSEFHRCCSSSSSSFPSLGSLHCRSCLCEIDVVRGGSGIAPRRQCASCRSKAAAAAALRPTVRRLCGSNGRPWRWARSSLPTGLPGLCASVCFASCCGALERAAAPAPDEQQTLSTVAACKLALARSTNTSSSAGQCARTHTHSRRRIPDINISGSRSSSCLPTNHNQEHSHTANQRQQQQQHTDRASNSLSRCSRRRRRPFSLSHRRHLSVPLVISL